MYIYIYKWKVKIYVWCLRIAVSLERGGNLVIVIVRLKDIFWCSICFGASVVQKKPLPKSGVAWCHGDSSQRPSGGMMSQSSMSTFPSTQKNRSLAKRWRGWVSSPNPVRKLRSTTWPAHVYNLVIWLSCWILRTLSYTWSHAFLASAISLTPSQVSGRSMRSQASLAAGPRQPPKQHITKGTRRWSRVGSVLEKLENHDY